MLDTQVVRIANVANSEGSVRIDGLDWNSDNFRVGYAGEGTMSMDIDATLNSTNGPLAHFAGSTGYAVVQGNWNIADNFIVGRLGETTLEISAGGHVTSSSSVIGDLAAGEGHVTLSATWETINALTIGDSGVASLTIRGPFGDVTSDYAFVGRLTGSDGLVVAENGVWTTSGRLSIGGDADTGTTGGGGTVEIAGGTVSVGEHITLFSGAQISLEDGSLVARIITAQPGAVFDWTGGQLIVDTFNGSFSNNGGTLAARVSSNSMLVSGEFSQGPTGVLVTKISGTAASHQYDSMIVGNTAFLGGELQSELVESVEPIAGEVYAILDALNIGAGSFSIVANGERLLETNGRGTFVVNYGAASLFDPSQVVLPVYQPLPTGDFDLDGDVDGRDFLMWQRNPIVGDLFYWQANYGNGSLVATNVAVPEPLGTNLLFLAISCRTAISRRSKRFMQ